MRRFPTEPDTRPGDQEAPHRPEDKMVRRHADKMCRRYSDKAARPAADKQE
jgi:hypothetical protein